MITKLTIEMTLHKPPNPDENAQNPPNQNEKKKKKRKEEEKDSQH